MAKTKAAPAPAPARKARAAKAAPAAAPAKKARAARATKEEIVEAAFTPEYEDILDTIERKFKLGQGAMSKEARSSSQISTGLLGTDLLFGGGILPGAWYTCFGGEGSAKSTHLAHIKIAAADSGVPIMADFDYEGSSTPDYYEGIFEFASTMKEIHELYGQKDADGKWITKPKVRYYNPSVAEDFFDSAASTLRRIPNKEFIDGRWWFSWDPTQENRGVTKGKHSKAMFSKYGRLFIEAPDGRPQAIYFLDSYPAMYPEKLDEDDKGQGMASVARAMSENVPKVFSKLRNKAVTIIGVNQLRLRPAVTHGCLHYNTQIHFVDGRVLPIGQVVEQQIAGEVWSMNERSGQLEPREIRAWHNNGTVPDGGWVVVKTQGIGTRNGIVSVTVTPNHEVLTDTGWKQAQELTDGDCVVTKYESRFNGTRAQFLAGVLTADSCLVADSRSINTSLRLQCSHDPKYVQWKIRKLGAFFKESNDQRGFKNFTSNPSYEWSVLHELVAERDPTKLLDHITPLSLAVMYMDDGHYEEVRGRSQVSYKRFKNMPKKQAAIAAMWARFGIQGRFNVRDGCLHFNRYNTERLHALIQRFVPSCMEHKLGRAYQGMYEDFALSCDVYHEECYAHVISVEHAGTKHYSPKTTKKYKMLYDITVAGNHNYLAGTADNGIVVHNSPEYEPGGETLKFSSSVRVRQSALVPPSGWLRDKDNTSLGRESSAIYEGAHDSYRYIKMKTIKNKLSTPYLTTMQRVWTDDGTGTPHGFCPAYDTFNYLKATGQMTGNMKSLKSPLIDLPKGIDWNAFKGLLVLKGSQLKQHCAEIGLPKNPQLRQRCFAQIKSGKGTELYFEALRSKGGGDDDDGDDD